MTIIQWIGIVFFSAVIGALILEILKDVFKKGK